MIPPVPWPVPPHVWECDSASPPKETLADTVWTAGPAAWYKECEDGSGSYTATSLLENFVITDHLAFQNLTFISC